jgi:transposase InsO family protein
VVQEAPSRTPSTATITEIRGPIEQEVEGSQDSTPEEGSIGESESVSILRSFIASRADYGASANCVSISSEGHRNRGYTLNARNTCDDSSLGRWRVDTLTGKVYRQRADGRFLDP